MTEPAVTPKFTAAVDLLRRSGARQIQVRFSDEQAPIVWMAIAAFSPTHWDAAAAPDPETAALRLCELVIDGGTCTHCGRCCGMDEEANGEQTMTAAADDLDLGDWAAQICWYRWDPELATFRRSCEGMTIEPAKDPQAARRRGRRR